ncbi:MAG TPA: MFS transporter, partial [Streptosporangiaceae bacterium]|nr:MFS transporter [Streptosporangiaceae bacterium]
GDDRPRPRLASGALGRVLLFAAGLLTSFYLLISVTPMYAASSGVGSAGAGLATGLLLLGTVAAELAASGLMKRFGYRTLLVIGVILMGAPALMQLTPGPPIMIVVASVVRGFGFGLGTVVTGALIAMLLPPERRGEGLGLAGVVESVPGVVALPAGVWLAGHFGYQVVIGLAAVAALAPLVAVRGVPSGPGPRGRGVSESDDAGAGSAGGLLAALRLGSPLRLSLVFAASTIAAGVVASFLPLATGLSANVATTGLLAQAVCAMIGRWGAGRQGDRHGHARLLIPGLVTASLGMTAMIWLTSPVAVIVGMCLFGTGFGIVENATFVLMIDRMPASGFGTASALWSLAYDAGYGAGPAAFGLLVAHTGYPAAFALTGALMLAAVPIARREGSKARACYKAPAPLSLPGLGHDLLVGQITEDVGEPGQILHTD